MCFAVLIGFLCCENTHSCNFDLYFLIKTTIMKRTGGITWIAAILVVLAGLGACQSTKTSTATKMLKFNLEKNKGYDYELTVSLDQEIMGQPMKMDMVTYYSMNVEGEENDTKNITTGVERFRMKSSVAGFNIDIDTDNPAPAGDTKNPLDILNRVFGAIKGQKFTMKVNAEGNITEVKGFEDMGQKIADSLGLEEDEKEKMKQQFSGQFNEDQVKQQLGRFWYIFPNKEVKVGDTWNKNTELGGRVPGKYNSTYKVTEIEGDMVTLDETTKIEAREEGKNLAGKVTGTLVVDSRTGLVVTADQDMTISVGDGGKSVEIKAKSKLKGKAR